jgi:Protein of unknown function (DUF3024)
MDCDHDPMSAGGLLDFDVARVQRWCASQVPEHLRSEIRVECDIAPRHLTICECRPPWCEDLGSDWTRFPIARLHYTKATGLWALYWRDRNLKYHRYQTTRPQSPNPGPTRLPRQRRRPDLLGVATDYPRPSDALTG